MKTVQFREALREAMNEEMRRDENVFLIGEEVAEYNGAYKVSQGMLDEFGAKRVIDTPIAELGFAGIAVGASMKGLRPIVEFMTWNFAILAADQIINSAAKMLQMSGGQYHCPIVFRGGNGTAGQLAATHSQSFEAFYEYIIPIGVADIKRKGTDVTIVSFGKILKVAYQAAEELEKEGISCEIIDLRTIRPLDYGCIVESVKKTNRCVVLEESWPLASISSEISYHLQRYAFDYLDAPVMRVTQSDTPFAFSPTLIAEALPNVKRLMDAVKATMYRN